MEDLLQMWTLKMKRLDPGSLARYQPNMFLCCVQAGAALLQAAVAAGFHSLAAVPQKFQYLDFSL